MKKEDIIRKLNELNFPKDQYWVNAGSAMTLYGLREDTHDIDIGCTTFLMDELIKRYELKYAKDGTRKVEIGEDIEIYENWLNDKITYINDIPVVSLKGILELKLFLNREKDQKDIKILKEKLNLK